MALKGVNLRQDNGGPVTSIIGNQILSRKLQISPCKWHTSQKQSSFLEITTEITSLISIKIYKNYLVPILFKVLCWPLKHYRVCMITLKCRYSSSFYWQLTDPCLHGQFLLLCLFRQTSHQIVCVWSSYMHTSLPISLGGTKWRSGAVDKHRGSLCVSGNKWLICTTDMKWFKTMCLDCVVQHKEK